MASISYRVAYGDKDSDNIGHYPTVEKLIADFTSDNQYSTCDVLIVDSVGVYHPAFSLTKLVIASGSYKTDDFKTETQILFGAFNK